MLPHSVDDFRAKTYDVFVSYKHLDAEVRDLLIEALETARLSVWYDAKLVSGAFRPQLAERINNSRLVIALWSAHVAVAPDEVRDEMSQARGLDRLMALRTDGTEIPRLFGEQNFMSFDGWSDPTKRRAQLEAIVAEVRRRVAAPTYRVVETGKGRAVTTLVAPPEFGDIPGAPDTLIGRNAELAMLREAWGSRPPRKVNAVVLCALGGAGKSALLRTFANDMLAAGGGGAARLYGWSAYSQGSGEQKGADADSFITKALIDFGWQGELPKDPVERARALAKIIQKDRVLLLLDGLEPLQDPPSVNKGRFKEKAFSELIRLLVGHNPGLAILTTRQEIPEVAGFGSLAIEHKLEELSDHAGADLLVELGVRGRQRELEAAVREVQGHALSVTLLGTYLAEVCGGDVRHRDRFDFADMMLSPEAESELLTDKTIIPANRAAKVMRGYLEQFDKLARGDAMAGTGGPERALLHLLGLFDRPADGLAVNALLAQNIPGLTDDLFVDRIKQVSGRLFKTQKFILEPLPEAKRIARLREAKSRLRKLRLLSKANPKDPHELDAHPIVRAFFAGHLGKTAPEAAQTAHGILYRHYAAAAPDLPNTVAEMLPLFHAVQHGVKARRAGEALDEILRRRIEHGDETHIMRTLGAFGPELAAFAHLFEVPWRTPLRELGASSRVWLLGSTAFALQALGRMSDSIEPRRAGLEEAVVQKDWRNAARSGGNLTHTLLTLGRIAEAMPVAQQAIVYADRSGDEAQRQRRRSNLATVHAAVGDLDIAATLFAQAEEIKARRSPDELQLISVHGYQYGYLLLSRGDIAAVLARGRRQLQLAERDLDRDMGLERISQERIGFAHLLLGRAQDSVGDADAAASFDAAVASLRKSGRTDLLPLALLARGAHWRSRTMAGDTGLIQRISADLAEVEDIAGEEMRLHLTDLALERARFALDVPAAFGVDAARAEAETQTTKATRLVADTGYHRRDRELADLRTRLAAS